MAKKASMEKLNELHNLLTEYYIETLEEGEEISSGSLSAINAFLKNNDVVAEVTESEPLMDLSAKLKEFMIYEKEEDND